MFITSLVGLAGEARDSTRPVQVNTVRKRRVISIVFLGRQLLNSSRLVLTKPALIERMQKLPQLVAEQVKFVGIPEPYSLDRGSLRSHSLSLFVRVLPSELQHLA